MAAIYRFVNQINQKCYVGQSLNPIKRMKEHLAASKNGDKKPLYAAIRKYKEENFIFEILEECSIELLNEREQYWITHFDSYNRRKGYNLTTGGKQCQFGPMSEEHKRKIGEANKISKKGSTLSEATRQKLSESLMGHEGYWAGKKMSEEHKQKISDGNKGRPKAPRTAEHCRKISEGKMGSEPWNKGGTSNQKYDLTIDQRHEPILLSFRNGSSEKELADQFMMTTKKIKLVLKRARARGNL